MSLLIDVLPSIVGLLVGAWIQITKQKMAMQQNREELYIRALAVKEESIKAARQFDSPHTSKVRKILVIGIVAPLCFFPMLIVLLNWVSGMVWAFNGLPWIAEANELCMAYPKEVTTGGLWSWFVGEKTEIDWITVCDFMFLPIYFYLAQLIGAFYLGQGAAKVTYN